MILGGGHRSQFKSSGTMTACSCLAWILVGLPCAEHCIACIACIASIAGGFSWVSRCLEFEGSDELRLHGAHQEMDVVPRKQITRGRQNGRSSGTKMI